MRFVFVKMRPQSAPTKKSLIVALSGKTFKKATDRNLLRRRIKSIIRSVADQSGDSYFITARKEALEAPFSELKKEILSQIKKPK